MENLHAQDTSVTIPEDMKRATATWTPEGTLFLEGSALVHGEVQQQKETLRDIFKEWGETRIRIYIMLALLRAVYKLHDVQQELVKLRCNNEKAIQLSDVLSKRVSP